MVGSERFVSKPHILYIVRKVLLRAIGWYQLSLSQIALSRQKVFGYF